MFTGIVEDLGEGEAIEHKGGSARIFVHSATVTQDARPGDSIAVNGVCLTVTGLTDGRLGAVPGTGERAASSPRGFSADVMGETLKRSGLDSLAPGSKVNLERSVRLEDRLGGHLVQGHVDDTATIIRRDPQEHWEVVRISLTISAIGADWFEVSLIPETLKRTTLGFRRPGETVNLEADVIAKYVEKLTGGTR